MVSSGADVRGSALVSPLHCLLGAAMELVWRHVLDVRRYPPHIAAGVFHAAAAVAIELIRGRLHLGATCRQRALKSGVHIIDIDVQHGGHGRVRAARVTKHYNRVADAKFGMADQIAGSSEAL